MRPLIFIPGILGSAMRSALSGARVWGGLADLYVGDHFDSLGFEPGTPHGTSVLRSIPIVPGVLEVDVYGGLLRELASACGYREGDIGRPAPGRNLFAFDFDWTEDPVATVRKLARAIRRVLDGTGAERVDLLGHSFGGILARACSILGNRDIGEWRGGSSDLGRRIARIFMVGTANAGALDNFRVLHEGFRFAPAGKLFGPLYASSLRQALFTLPPPGAPVFVDRGTRKGLPADLYDAETWRQLGFGIFRDDVAIEVGLRMKSRHGRNGPRATARFFEREWTRLSRDLLRAKRLSAILDSVAPGEEGPAHFVLGGARKPTLVRALADRTGGKWRLSFPRPTLGNVVRFPDLFSTGDGETPIESLLALDGIPHDHVLLAPRDHRTLLKDRTLLDGLCSLLCSGAGEDA